MYFVRLLSTKKTFDLITKHLTEIFTFILDQNCSDLYCLYLHSNNFRFKTTKMIKNIWLRIMNATHINILYARSKKCVKNVLMAPAL